MSTVQSVPMKACSASNRAPLTSKGAVITTIFIAETGNSVSCLLDKQEKRHQTFSLPTTKVLALGRPCKGYEIQYRVG